MGAKPSRVRCWWQLHRGALERAIKSSAQQQYVVEFCLSGLAGERLVEDRVIGQRSLGGVKLRTVGS